MPMPMLMLMLMLMMMMMMMMLMLLLLLLLLLLLFSLSLLPQDVVFIIRKNGSVEARTTLEAGPQAQGMPLTLLVDKGTASAAEVFAAAVR